MCKISIVMPVYNKEKYIKNAIESVISQTFKDWELIIIDDGSVDNSYEICKQFSDERIHVYHTKNQGVSIARNYGMSLARGEYITFIDGDDTVSENYLKHLYIPESEMVIGGLQMVDANGSKIKEIVPTLSGNLEIRESALSFYKEQIRTGIYGFVSSKLVKRSIIEQGKIEFDKSINLAEDYDFFLKIYNLINKVQFVNVAEYFYEQDTDNSAISMKDEKIDFYKQIEIQNETKKFLQRYQSFGQYEQKIYNKIISGYIYTILLMNAKLSQTNFVNAVERLKEYNIQADVYENIFMKIILDLYKKGNVKLLYFILKIKDNLKKKWRIKGEI